MYLGTRRIRSAGRTSGSIEITLPTPLQVLEGAECRLMVRDGPRPEILLQPDLSAAQALFHNLWQRLCLGLGGVDELGSFSAGDFTLALFPPRHWRERPPLAYTDALAVLRSPTTDHRPPTSTGSSTVVSRQPSAGARGEGVEALTRLLAFLGVAAGYRLGLRGALGLAFGDAVAYLITSIPAGLGTDFERGMAHRIFWGEGRGEQPMGSPFDDHVWQQAQAGLRRVYDQFQDWQENPEAYAESRERWYRALTVEMGVQASSVEEYIGR